MFEAGILETIEDIGYSIRDNASIATHPEIRECDMRSTAKDHLREDYKGQKASCIL